MMKSALALAEFKKDEGVGFGFATLANRVQRFCRVDLAEGPGGGAADERFGVVQAADESGDGGDCLLIAQDNGRIAEDAAAAGAPERRVAKAAAEGIVVEVEERDEIDGTRQFGILDSGFWIGVVGNVVARRVGGRSPPYSMLVPGADVLANIAAKKPVADATAKLQRNRFAELDCEITNATGGIEDIGLRKGVGRAGVKARAACAAVVGGKGLVGGQFKVD